MPPLSGKIQKITSFFQKSNSIAVSDSSKANLDKNVLTDSSLNSSQLKVSYISQTLMTGSTSLQALLAYDRLDIGNYIATRLTIPDGLKPELLQKPWIPPHQYDFPKYLQKVKGKDRFSCFQYNWFNKFNWLVYSVAKNGSFCKFCVLFAPTSVAGPSLGLHIEVAFSGAQHYVSQRRLLCEHAGKGYHLTAALKLECFLATLSSSTVVDNLSTASQQLLKSKKDYLEGFASVINCVRRSFAKRFLLGIAQSIIRTTDLL